jgi:hypothetical protein
MRVGNLSQTGTKFPYLLLDQWRFCSMPLAIQSATQIPCIAPMNMGDLEILGQEQRPLDVAEKTDTLLRYDKLYAWKTMPLG